MAKNKYAILILAAGGSKRLGHPKQLVKWNQSTLLNHTIDQAVNVNECDVYVTLGSNHSAISQVIPHNVPYIKIQNWEDGMGASISSSLNQVDIQDYEAIIISVCDQPYITDSIFQKLLTEYKKGRSNIIISKYQNSSGPPTLFAKKYYRQLLDLKGDVGAKEIVKNNSDDVAFVQFPNGDFDVDTEDDVDKLAIE